MPRAGCNWRRAGKRSSVMLLAVVLLTEPVVARGVAPSPFGDLFGDMRPQRRAKRLIATPAVVPLPKPRPAEAPAARQAAPASPTASPAPTVEAPSEPAPPSACRLALTDSIAIAPSIPDISGPGDCGGTDLVRLDAVVLPDGGRVALKPAATMRCEMANAVARWVREDIAPLASAAGAPLGELDNFDSFECRGRNRVAGAKLSEHGHANALDVQGFTFGKSAMLSLTERATPRDLREKVLASVCARFTTVLGPGSDGYHEDHIHLDLAQRRSGYRICQWAIYDPLPQVAPLMPAERPADAPPRETKDETSPAPQDETPAAQNDVRKGEASPPASITQQTRSRRQARP